jgi:16S rRNA (guanine(527)-N(7))-methyltransferase RsmG
LAGVDTSSTSRDLRQDLATLAGRYALGPRELGALTVFVDRVRGSEHGGGVKEKWRQHGVARLAESLEALELEQVRAAEEAADIGSGAGFPGLALGAALPATQMTLIEQKAKRCEFLRDSVEAMGIGNVAVVQRLVQLWVEGQGRFDLVTSRGVLKPAVMVGLAAPLLKIGGTLVLWAPAAESDRAEDDARAAAGQFGLLPADIVRKGAVHLHVFTKRESRAAVPGVQALPHRSPKPRRKSALGPERSEARIAKLSTMIADFEERRSHAPAAQRAQLDFDIQRLEARRAAFAGELERQSRRSPSGISLREVEDADLPIFFEHQQDPAGVAMANVPSRDRDAFMAHWRKIRADPTVVVRTVELDGAVAGNVVSWQSAERRLVGYWIGREYWGRGIATAALRGLLEVVLERPLHALVAADNAGSIRVLEKCGFVRIGADEEGFVFRLDARTEPSDRALP